MKYNNVKQTGGLKFLKKNSILEILKNETEIVFCPRLPE